MNWKGFIAVGAGGALGCCVRYLLGLLLDPLLPHLPLGTLAVNWIAGFCMGCLIGLFQVFETLPVELRLFTATGILGGLSTFSGFSEEAVRLLVSGSYGWCVLLVISHIVGTLLLTVAGLSLMRLIFRERYEQMDNPEPEK